MYTYRGRLLPGGAGLEKGDRGGRRIVSCGWRGRGAQLAALTVVADHFESKAANLCEPRACRRDDDRVKPLRIDLDEVDGLRRL